MEFFASSEVPFCVSGLKQEDGFACHYWKKYLCPRCAKSFTLTPVLMSGCGRSEAVAEVSECVVSRAISLTRLLNLRGCSHAVFLFCSTFNMCQMSLPAWFLSERWSTRGTAQQTQQLMMFWWWAAAPGAPRHQAVFPMDNHRKHHPSPICSCQRGFTKIGRAHPFLELSHWPMPHQNLFIYRIFHIWPSSSILIPCVLVDFYILCVQMHTLNDV